MEESTPKELTHKGWHLPLTTQDDAVYRTEEIILASIGRVARVSYLRHEDESTFEKDVERARKLIENGHMSPCEHIARPMTEEEVEYLAHGYVNGGPAWNGPPYVPTGMPFLGNFCGWVQYRKMIPGENDMLWNKS